MQVSFAEQYNETNILSVPLNENCMVYFVVHTSLTIYQFIINSSLKDICQSAEIPKRVCHHYCLRLCHIVILISNVRISLSMRINWMAFI